MPPTELTGGAPPNSIALASMGSSLRCATSVGTEGSRLGSFLKNASCGERTNAGGSSTCELDACAQCASMAHKKESACVHWPQRNVNDCCMIV